MRSLVYTIAVIAAAGIMYGIIQMPSEPSTTGTATSATAISVDTTSTTGEPLETVAINVPEMMCQFSCFPHVKETLEELDAVAEVKLAEQADPNTLDNRQVIMTYKRGFDPDSVLNLLSAEGFTDSEVVQ